VLELPRRSIDAVYMSLLDGSRWSHPYTTSQSLQARMTAEEAAQVDADEQLRRGLEELLLRARARFPTVDGLLLFQRDADGELVRYVECWETLPGHFRWSRSARNED